MKKVISIMLSALVVVACMSFIGCGENGGEPEEKTLSVKYYDDASSVMPMMISGKETIALLPEPAATTLTKKATDKTWYRLDLQELYDGTAKAYPQAAIMVKQSVLKNNPGIVNKISAAFAENVNWVKSNTEAAVTAISGAMGEGAVTSLNAKTLSETVIDNCKIYWQSAADGKTSVAKYVGDMIEIDEKSAKAVKDDFFYNENEEIQSEVADKQEISVYAPDGAPALAIAKFINDNESFETGKTFNYHVINATTIGGIISKGTGDIIVMPITAASKLYASYAADTYKMVSVVTHGNLYIMSTEKLTVNDLNNKRMAVIGQGNVPDLTLKAVLKKNNIKTVIAE